MTLEDTQGMFLLLAAGVLMGITALISEWMGGFTRKCCFRKKIPPRSISEEELAGTPDVDELRVLSNGTDSRLDFSTRSTSVSSKDTLDGKIINVTEENILVHNHLNTDRWESRRSSSIDLDREVRDIFDKDEKRRRLRMNTSFVNSENNEDTASKNIFGDKMN